MSSATTLLQSSDVESSSTTSEADTSSLEAALTTTHAVKMLMDKGESKVSYMAAVLRPLNLLMFAS